MTAADTAADTAAADANLFRRIRADHPRAGLSVALAIAVLREGGGRMTLPDLSEGMTGMRDTTVAREAISVLRDFGAVTISGLKPQTVTICEKCAPAHIPA